MLNAGKVSCVAFEYMVVSVCLCVCVLRPSTQSLS